ncbi:MAG: 4-hydroxy-tetrahydrodipicolinate synthase [Clostridia bacterium]|nr:4-hydroxy-tetrahydrodipicolinate synthase [Clostridia bacterium]MBN2883998.1 4-hydroxy-tetrahydrodipicolinate synthase [Clostridia bacterium]
MPDKKVTIFKGTATAMATPFKDGRVDFDTLGRMIDFQIIEGIDALLFCGTTGESSTMPDEEHIDVVRFGVKHTKGRVPVIANAGSNDTAHAIELSKMAQDAGADALLSVAPYYNKSIQRGLVRHFEVIANSVKLPIILYNVPSRTVVNINADTIIKLSEVPNIVGVKECNIFQVADVISGTPDDFSVYSGSDDEVLQFMALGAKGLISVMSNIIPGKSHTITEAFLKGDIYTSRNIFYEIHSLVKALGLDTNPIPIKKALSLMHMGTSEVRLPLVEMEDDHTSILKEAMKKLRLI